MVVATAAKDLVALGTQVVLTLGAVVNYVQRVVAKVLSLPSNLTPIEGIPSTDCATLEALGECLQLAEKEFPHRGRVHPKFEKGVLWLAHHHRLLVNYWQKHRRGLACEDRTLSTNHHGVFRLFILLHIRVEQHRLLICLLDWVLSHLLLLLDPHWLLVGLSLEVSFLLF